tara:strand:+ start:206 stop:1231 length:1026 start_codon:yes stop_codon:yes gene_type:complete
MPLGPNLSLIGYALGFLIFIGISAAAACLLFIALSNIVNQTSWLYQENKNNAEALGDTDEQVNRTQQKIIIYQNHLTQTAGKVLTRCSRKSQATSIASARRAEEINDMVRAGGKIHGNELPASHEKIEAAKNELIHSNCSHVWHRPLAKDLNLKTFRLLSQESTRDELLNEMKDEIAYFKQQKVTANLESINHPSWFCRGVFSEGQEALTLKIAHCQHTAAMLRMFAEQLKPNVFGIGNKSAVAASDPQRKSISNRTDHSRTIETLEAMATELDDISGTMQKTSISLPQEPVRPATLNPKDNTRLPHPPSWDGNNASSRKASTQHLKDPNWLLGQSPARGT